MSSVFLDCCEGFGNERVKCVCCSLVCVLYFLLWSLALDSCNDKLNLRDPFPPLVRAVQSAPQSSVHGERQAEPVLLCSLLEPCVLEPISACGGHCALVFLLPSSTLRSQFPESSLMWGSHPLLPWVLPHVSIVPHVMVALISQRGGSLCIPRRQSQVEGSIYVPTLGSEFSFLFRTVGGTLYYG